MSDLNLDIELSDQEVWLRFATARASGVTEAASSVPEAVAYANRALVEFRKRFPKAALPDPVVSAPPAPAASPTPTSPAQDISLTLSDPT